MLNHKLFLLFLSLAALTAKAGFVVSEPENSALAQGHWVKIRVTENGVYGFSDDRLRELGFENPEAVRVYGYDPTLLLDHNFSTTPSDMNQLQSLHENSQLVFYAVGNVDYRAELWRQTPIVSSTVINRRVHSYSKGATYFLSDVPAENIAITSIQAPESTAEFKIFNSHDAVIYNENDAENYGEGSIWFSGPAISNNGSETHHISVSKATGNASLSYLGLISTSAGTQSKNFFNVEYSNGISSNALSGLGAKKFSTTQQNHYLFHPCWMTHNLTFPKDAPDPFEFDITFRPSQTCGTFDKSGSIDYFALVYGRRNNLAGENQMLMYFNNTDSVALASLTGYEPNGGWHIWNVAKANIREHEVLNAEQGTFVYLPIAEKENPNALAVFCTNEPQPEPEVIGTVANQNLHAISVPDLVIVAAKPMMEAAELAADFHRELQGLDVAVVDQQQIFNEYGSGNISPESLRRFFAHLYQRDPQKLKAILLIGGGTYLNARTISDESPKVVTAQMEWYAKANDETINDCTDAFFGSFNNNTQSNPYYSVISAGMTIPVGRLPFDNISDVQAYYGKARRYIADKHSYPAAGNLVLASDYATRPEDSHMANGENLFKAIPDDKRSQLTVTRAASNLFSVKDNNVNRKVLMSALERGASFYAYFGHGGLTQIGGSVTNRDYLTHISTVTTQNHPGRYPFMFVGSCHVGAFDQGANLASQFVANEFGGGIAVIAASRMAYQNKNEEFGKKIIKSYYDLKAGDWLGQAWLKGVNSHITSNAAVDYVLNTCCYNFLGDPAIPSFAPTHSIVFDDFESLLAGGENILSGSVADGEDFNGEILLSVYDSPITLKNLAPAFTTPAATTIDECEIDQELIGEYIGKVVNGHFEVKFRGPRSGRPGTHRIQAYAYSSDDAYRALGVVSAQMVDAETPYEPTTDALPSINDFIAGTGETDVNYTDAVELTATIYAPAGIADANALLNPVRLTIDGVAQTNIRRLLSPIDDNAFALSYRTNNLSGGRHSATLQALDANGNIAEASVEFSIDNAPKANLSVAIDDDGANFEYALNSSASINNAMLIIENLAGETIKYIPFANNSTSCNVNDLKSGAYRAYVQLAGNKVATATPKIEVIIN